MSAGTIPQPGIHKDADGEYEVAECTNCHRPRERKPGASNPFVCDYCAGGLLKQPTPVMIVGGVVLSMNDADPSYLYQPQWRSDGG